MYKLLITEEFKRGAADIKMTKAQKGSQLTDSPLRNFPR